MPLVPLGRGGNLVGPVLLVVLCSKALAAAAAAAAVPPADEMEESKVPVLFMLVSLCISRPLPPKRDRAPLPPPMFSSDGQRCLVLAMLIAVPFSAKPPPTSSCSSRGPMLSSRTRAADDDLLLLALPPLPDRFRPYGLDGPPRLERLPYTARRPRAGRLAVAVVDHAVGGGAALASHSKSSPEDMLLLLLCCYFICLAGLICLICGTSTPNQDVSSVALMGSVQQNLTLGGFNNTILIRIAASC